MDFPRRNSLEKFIPAERAIWDATQVVESAGAHPLLTDAVNLLSKARAKVADFADAAPPDQKDDESEADDVHRAWMDAMAGLCKHVGINPDAVPWDPAKTTEETVGNIVGYIQDRLPAGGGFYATVPSAHDAHVAPGSALFSDPTKTKPTPDICGHVGSTRSGEVTVVCSRPAGHDGKHGGMGCEWSDAARPNDQHLGDAGNV